MAKRLAPMILFVTSFVGVPFPQQTSDNKSSGPTIPTALKEYLSLSTEQVLRLENTLKAYQQLVSSKRAEMRSMQMKAAVNPSVSANRVLESDNAEIQKARCKAREDISALFSSEQVSRLLQLRSNSSSDAEHAMLAAEAANLDLIDRPDNIPREAFGGTTSIFAPDTKSQPELPDQQNQKKAASKRNPPKSPPQ